MSSPTILGFWFDDDNEEKFGEHGLSAERVDEILDSEYLVLGNRSGRRGHYLIIGHDRGGTCIATPVEPTQEPGIWRPITAWRCKEHERRALEGR